MKTMNQNVSKEIYEAYINAGTRGEQYSIAESTLSRGIIMGYGFYGCENAFEKDGKYYIAVRIGETCD